MQRAHAGRGWRPLGKAWHRVACAQVAFHGMALCCMVLDGTAKVTEAHIWCGTSLVWHGLCPTGSIVWYSMVVNGVAQVFFHGMAIYGMVWDGTAQVAETQVWYGMTCAQLALHVMQGMV